VDVTALLESLDAVGAETDLRPAVALLAARDLELEPDELTAARRRALLLLAAGGDPHRGLVLDGRAVTALADELDTPGRRAELAEGLEALAYDAVPFPSLAKAVSALRSDPSLAWRAYACALLAEELDED
jgi:hypothetical protein